MLNRIQINVDLFWKFIYILRHRKIFGENTHSLLDLISYVLKMVELAETLAALAFCFQYAGYCAVCMSHYSKMVQREHRVITAHW